MDLTLQSWNICCGDVRKVRHYPVKRAIDPIEQIRTAERDSIWHPKSLRILTSQGKCIIRDINSDNLQFRLFQRDFLPFFKTLRNHADQRDELLATPRGGNPWALDIPRFHADVIRSSAAAADATSAFPPEQIGSDALVPVDSSISIPITVASSVERAPAPTKSKGEPSARSGRVRRFELRDLGFVPRMKATFRCGGDDSPPGRVWRIPETASVSGHGSSRQSARRSSLKSGGGGAVPRSCRAAQSFAVLVPSFIRPLSRYSTMLGKPDAS